ncbi:zinc finger protein 516-like [Kryptolebias marmoratus]|uniref:zinc finger protein 516-like n=1 Tax=Kryptolebias marmoratus TaxID=37003 RepID=UPI0007F86C5F|nr:zinc finger protein 516-like [Kryptolebias marmoratus]XP_037831801.1 zinc finger protein 516-like [Kryptolebias marmoratus]XP_037831802.1 zinc finger protein 516-like [Kryptolebias marmoratus]
METEEKEDVSQQTLGIKAETEEDTASSHTCGVCGRSFPLLSSLSQHMRRHTREKPYKCPYCEHRAAQKGSLKAHIRSHKLGLFSHDSSGKKEEGEQEKKNGPDVPDPPETISTSDKTHPINGVVKKKATKKKVKSKNGVEVGDAADSGPFSCTVCGQVFPQVLLLKSHIKRHRGSQDHGCHICGRRFRQAWFLQSHMRIHRVKAQLRGSKSNEPPATVNGIPQDPASLTNEVCLYELCASCGNFFYDRKTLRIHEKLHKMNHGHPQNPPHKDVKASELRVDKKHFLESLNLTTAKPKETPVEKILGGRIPELDPVCSYQAWQLATRGRLVEAAEKCLGWEERLADAEVAYDTEKGEYVPLKPEKKRKPIDTSHSNLKKKKGDTGVDHTSNTLGYAKGGDKKICQKDRILLNGLGHAFYEALQKKAVKDVQLSSKLSKTARSQEKEDKKSFFCEHCDFHTVDSSLLRSHLYSQHLGSYSKHSAIVDNVSKGGSGASKYMDYLRSRSLLLSQPYWTPCTKSPGQELAEENVKMGLSNGSEVKEEGQATGDTGSLLNLSSSSLAGGNSTAGYSVQTEGLVRHQCLYCSHKTSYPEVLWIHQRVAHKVNGNSSVAPKWAPCINTLKSSKAGASQWRRTGPPPFLEGKDCPALPAPRTQRTQPPGFTTRSSSRSGSGSSSSSKHLTLRTQSGTSKSKHHSKDSRSSDGTQSAGKVGLQPQRSSGEHKRAAEGGSKGSSGQATSLNSSTRTKRFDGFQPSSSPKHRGDRAAAEGIFPQEGLGFMLVRNHSGASSNAAAADRAHSRRQSCDFSPGLKSPDLWAAMNMWGPHGAKAYSDPLLFAQGKSESTGEMPKDVDILSFLKNYSPRDLAALYQHWGFVDPRLDPQTMLQLNGHFGNEVHSSSEASKQMNSLSTSSSGSLHKGT